MTRYEAHVRKDWRSAGITTVIVARHREDSSVDVAFVLVDVWCLGVKDAFAEFNAPASWVEDKIRSQIPEDQHERMHPACAKKLIEGAVAYAEGLGFAAHRDYRKARKVFSGVDASVCPTDFTFGRDGKPFYVAGENDSEERINRVLAVLKARCGEDGFHYVCPVEGEDEEEFSQEVRDALMDLLEDAPESAPKFYEFSGFVTALQLCPQAMPPETVREVLAGEEFAEWRNTADLEELETLLMEYWTYVEELIAEATAPDANEENQVVDVWLTDFPDEQLMRVMVASYLWANGFIRAVKLRPEAWAAALARPDLAEHWDVIRWWASVLEEGGNRKLVESLEAGEERRIGDSAIALAKALRRAPDAKA